MRNGKIPTAPLFFFFAQLFLFLQEKSYTDSIHFSAIKTLKIFEKKSVSECACVRVPLFFTHSLFFFYNFILSFFSIHYIGVAPTVAPTVANTTASASLCPIFQFITSLKQVAETVVTTVTKIAPRNATRFVRQFNTLNHNR